MGNCIMKLDGRYLIWSTVVDAPTTELMTLEEFEVYYRNQYGRTGMEGLPHRMERVKAKGNSFFSGMTNDEVIAGNRAGENETELSKEQIVQVFYRREP